MDANRTILCRLAASIRCANRGITGTCGSATCSRARRTLAYTTALDLPEGVLIYATEEGGAPDRAVDVRNTDHRLWTYRVDLTGNTGDVANELQLLSDWILDRTVALSPRPLSGYLHDVEWAIRADRNQSGRSVCTPEPAPRWLRSVSVLR